MNVQKGDKLIVKKGAMITRYGAIPGRRFERTTEPSKRPRRITVERVDAVRYEPPGDDPKGHWQTLEGPFVSWAGSHGYWHWCLLSECETA